ncbi:MAG TPA: OmpA family protein, partial [Stellaceae bacterium]|nr:OmpA family protein [Stellaceae bacterium]
PNTVLKVFGQFPAAVNNGSIAALYEACQIPGVQIGVLCNTTRNGRPALDSGLPFLQIGPSTTQTGDIDTTYANGPSFAKVDSFGGGFTIDYKLDDTTTVKSITGYRATPNWNIGIDLDGAADNGQFLNVTDKQSQRQVTQELQLNGTAFDSRLNYVAGLYYFNEWGYVHDFVPFDGGLLMVYDGSGNTIDTTNYAGYVHADYKVTDEIGITLGGRYSYEKKDFTGSQSDENGLSYKASGCYPPTASAALLGAPAFLTCQELLGFPVPGQPLRYFPDQLSTQKFYEFTPTAGVQYHFNEDLMAYFNWAKGFKSGGWTTRLSAPISNSDQAAFGPEKDETYEIGLKSEWFDHHLLLNWAGYYSQYDNIQLQFQEEASPVTRNAGNADILGTELEGHALLGDGLSLTTAASYIDAYYTYIIPGVTSDPATCGLSCVFIGTKLPKTPKWKINLSPEYDYTLGNDATLRFLLSYTHTSSLFNDVYETPQLRRPTEDIIDASVQYVSPDDQYEVVLGGTNITDQRYITVGSINYGAAFVDGTYNPPAEWYLTLRYKFHPAPAPAVAAPPPVPAAQPTPPPQPKVEAQRSFQVFFDFDKSNITDAAAKVIQAAADAVKQGNVVQITVTGHTDTVGTAAYNQGLSERRAASVKTQLVTDGVAAGEITTVGVGKNGLLVPTADGVREPQNRRAEIVLQ